MRVGMGGYVASSPDNLPRQVGGRVCLDFANTVEGRAGDASREHVPDYGRLVTWARHVGVLTEVQAQSLSERASRSRRAAERVHRTALDLREAMYRTFSAIAGGREPEDADLESLSDAWTAALAHARPVRSGGHYVLEWSARSTDLERVLWPLAYSALELLLSDDLLRLKECPGGGEEPCTWLFVDYSKNAVRRWCSMQDCGNAAKARRQTQRRRSVRNGRRSVRVSA